MVNLTGFNQAKCVPGKKYAIIYINIIWLEYTPTFVTAVFTTKFVSSFANFRYRGSIAV